MSLMDNSFGDVQVHKHSKTMIECESCGYEMPGPMPRRCPRCFSYSTMREFTPNEEMLDVLITNRRRNSGPLPIRQRPSRQLATVSLRNGVFTFDLHHVAQQAYLMIRAADGSARKLQPMHRIDPDIDGEENDQSFWRLTARIGSGAYHFRHYIDDGSHIDPIDPEEAESPSQARPEEQTLIVTASTSATLISHGSRIAVKSASSSQPMPRRRRRRRSRSQMRALRQAKAAPPLPALVA